MTARVLNQLRGQCEGLKIRAMWLRLKEKGETVRFEGKDKGEGEVVS